MKRLGKGYYQELYKEVTVTISVCSDTGAYASYWQAVLTGGKFGDEEVSLDLHHSKRVARIGAIEFIDRCKYDTQYGWVI